MTGRVGVDVFAVELNRAERQDARAGAITSDHDVEVKSCCGTAGSGQVGGRWPGTSWKARPDAAALPATTTQSSLR